MSAPSSQPVQAELGFRRVLELERRVRDTFRAKRHAVAASGEWWLLGRVISSTLRAYRSLAALAARSLFAKK
jgi:hypothetical protein